MKVCTSNPRKYKLSLKGNKWPKIWPTLIFTSQKKKKKITTDLFFLIDRNKSSKIVLLPLYKEFSYTVRSINNKSVCYHSRDSINTCTHSTVCKITNENYMGFQSSVSCLGLGVWDCKKAELLKMGGDYYNNENPKQNGKKRSITDLTKCKKAESLTMHTVKSLSA